jgi:hypothetical protein
MNGSLSVFLVISSFSLISGVMTSVYKGPKPSGIYMLLLLVVILLS